MSNFDFINSREGSELLGKLYELFRDNPYSYFVTNSTELMKSTQDKYKLYMIYWFLCEAFINTYDYDNALKMCDERLTIIENEESKEPHKYDKESIMLYKAYINSLTKSNLHESMEICEKILDRDIISNGIENTFYNIFSSIEMIIRACHQLGMLYIRTMKLDKLKSIIDKVDKIEKTYPNAYNAISNDFRYLDNKYYLLLFKAYYNYYNKQNIDNLFCELKTGEIYFTEIYLLAIDLAIYLGKIDYAIEMSELIFNRFKNKSLTPRNIDFHIFIENLIKENEFNTNEINIIQDIFTIINILRLPNLQKSITRYLRAGAFNAIYTSTNISTFRLNSATAMNDKFEGSVIPAYFGLENITLTSKDNMYLASLTLNNNNSMAMWQTTYADGCKGISFSFDHKKNIMFVEHDNITVEKIMEHSQANSKDGTKLRYELYYYRIAYYDSDRKIFRVYKSELDEYEILRDEKLSVGLTDMFHKLQEQIKNINNEFLIKVSPLLTFLSYLVKDKQYWYENEVRLMHYVYDIYKLPIDNRGIRYYDTKHKLIPSDVMLSPRYSKLSLSNNIFDVVKDKLENEHREYYKNDVFKNYDDLKVQISDIPYDFGDDGERKNYPKLPNSNNDGFFKKLKSYGVKIVNFICDFL